MGLLLTILVCMQIHYTRYNWNYLNSLETYEATLRQQLIYVGNYLDKVPDANSAQIIKDYESKHKKKFLIYLGQPRKNTYQNKTIKFWKKNKLNLYKEV